MFEYRDGDGPMRIGDGGRTNLWWVPDETTALAAADGEVVVAGPSATGYRVWIHHGARMHTGYFHLSKLATRMIPGQRVLMGDPVGIVGDSPRGDDPRHLHWEVHTNSLSSYPAGSIDPERFLIGASILGA